MGAVIGKDVVIWTDKIDKGHAFLLQIGNRVTISDARILLHDASTKRYLGYSRVGRVVIGDDVFIGADAIILPGVTIGNDVIIGAGTIVTSDIPDDSVVVGSPAKIIGKCSEYVERNKNLMKNAPRYNTYWAQKSIDEKKDMNENLKNNRIGFDI